MPERDDLTMLARRWLHWADANAGLPAGGRVDDDELASLAALLESVDREARQEGAMKLGVEVVARSSGKMLRGATVTCGYCEAIEDGERIEHGEECPTRICDELRAELAQARTKAAQLHRRCQSAESGLAHALDTPGTQTLGRALANCAAHMYRAQSAELQEALKTIAECGVACACSAVARAALHSVEVGMADP